MLQLKKIRRQDTFFSLLPCICKAKSTFLRVNSYIAFLLVCVVTGIQQIKTKTFGCDQWKKKIFQKRGKNMCLAS